MLLHLDHQVVDVDELRADREGLQRGQRQDLVEAVVVLDQLRQRPLRVAAGCEEELGPAPSGPPPPSHQVPPPNLDDGGPVLEVGEGAHHVLAKGLHRGLPRGGKATYQLRDPGCGAGKVE